MRVSEQGAKPEPPAGPEGSPAPAGPPEGAAAPRRGAGPAPEGPGVAAGAGCGRAGGQGTALPGAWPRRAEQRAAGCPLGREEGRGAAGCEGQGPRLKPLAAWRAPRRHFVGLLPALPQVPGARPSSLPAGLAVCCAPAGLQGLDELR